VKFVQHFKRGTQTVKVWERLPSDLSLIFHVESIIFYLFHIHHHSVSSYRPLSSAVLSTYSSCFRFTSSSHTCVTHACACRLCMCVCRSLQQSPVTAAVTTSDTDFAVKQVGQVVLTTTAMIVINAVLCGRRCGRLTLNDSWKGTMMIVKK
jgi:hypothetical protein